MQNPNYPHSEHSQTLGVSVAATMQTGRADWCGKRFLMCVAKHLDLAAIASMSPARSLGYSAWPFDGLHVVPEGTQMPACLCVSTSTQECQGQIPKLFLILY